jgi:RNA polymerase-binding transcription factor DksA
MHECDAGNVNDWPDPSELGAIRDAWSGERVRLLLQIDSLEHRFDDIVSAAELTSTDDEHDPEGTTIAYERAQVWALLAQARHDLAAIDEAAPGLADGELPTCHECLGPIGAERLLALPGVRTCIRCAL